MSNRKGPTDSATIYEIGTKRKGNDGRTWVVKSFNGVKKWAPVVTKNLVVRGGRIKSFGLQNVIKLVNRDRVKQLGKLAITSNRIGIGELLFGEFPAKIGAYNIYQYKKSLIAVHEDYSVLDQVFSVTHATVVCDIGMFSFNNIAEVRPYLDRKKRNKYFPSMLNMPNFDTIIFTRKGRGHRIKHYDAFYLYESDFEAFDKDAGGKEREQPLALYAGNGFGDGEFQIYKGQSAYLIMSVGMIQSIAKLYV